MNITSLVIHEMVKIEKQMVVIFMRCLYKRVHYPVIRYAF